MRTYALIGKPLSHSFSQTYFKEKFAKDNIQADYILKPLDSIDSLETWIASLPTLQGFNVTMPYKKQILKYITETDISAKRCGNVNCVKIIRRNDKTILKGYNTDFCGFKTSLQESFNIDKIHSALILGNGGVAGTLSAVLQDLNINFKIATRNPYDADKHINYTQANNSLHNFQLIINATPCGMHPNETSLPPIDCTKLEPYHNVFDLIYNPSETLFLKQAKAKGCTTANGYRMLTLQADKAWEIWQNE